MVNDSSFANPKNTFYEFHLHRAESFAILIFQLLQITFVGIFYHLKYFKKGEQTQSWQPQTFPKTEWILSAFWE